MDKKQSPKMAALLELRKMVEELINNDFQSEKMPKLMALKVTKVEPLVETEESEDEMEAPEMEESDESPEHEAEEFETPSLSDAIKSAAESEGSKLGNEPCPECGEMECGCDAMGMEHGMSKKPMVKAIAIKSSTVESPGVAKLKKLLGK